MASLILALPGDTPLPHPRPTQHGSQLWLLDLDLSCHGREGLSSVTGAREEGLDAARGAPPSSVTLRNTPSGVEAGL